MVIATKNYLAHKHNSVINKHRSNALLTFNALVDAAGPISNKEIILTHASSCIFSPQQTGFSSSISSEFPAQNAMFGIMKETLKGDK